VNIIKALMTICMITAAITPAVSYAEEQTQPYFQEIDPREPLDPWMQSFAITEKLYEGKSDFQDILIFENSRFGRMLALDGVVQTTEADEFIYHEMIVHVPMLTHPEPKKVLIIGGGDGGSLREVLRHKTVEQVTMVDLDGQVVDLCKKWLPNHSSGAFDDQRVKLVIQDGTQFVKETQDTFDVIICDTTDPIGPGKVLFSSEFYADCKKILNPEGLISMQNGIPFTNGLEITSVFANIAHEFKHVSFYVAPVPSYLGGYLAFGIASEKYSNYALSSKKLSKRLHSVKGSMRYYNPKIHKASFALPEYVNQYIPKIKKK